MVSASRPTARRGHRLANAVLERTDAVMLSAETAVGSYPVEAVQAMSRIAAAVEPPSATTSCRAVAFRDSEPTFPTAPRSPPRRPPRRSGSRRSSVSPESGRHGAPVVALPQRGRDHAR